MGICFFSPIFVLLFQIYKDIPPLLHAVVLPFRDVNAMRITQ